MSTAGRRRGRRDNGLDAAGWRAIEDLDPRVSGDVLDLLASRGIAAYVQPAVDVDPVTRSATLPARPSDRLYVDRLRTAAARECLRSFLGGPVAGERPDRPAGTGRDASDGSDLDATFAGIVAGFDQPVDPSAVSWPALEDVGSPAADPPPEPAPDEPPAPSRPPDARHLTEPSLLDALDTFGTGLPDDPAGPADRFVPPTPPPLPRLSRQAVLGGVSILVGLVVLLGGPGPIPISRTGAIMLGFATMLGGAVALILRLRPGTDPEERPPDDGAQV